MSVTVGSCTIIGYGPNLGNVLVGWSPFYTVEYLVVAGGGGGGGGSAGLNGTGGAGGSGIVILAVPTPRYPGSAPGATVTTPPAAPGMTVLTYTNSGTYRA